MKNRFKTIRIILSLFTILIVFTNCEKHTTPNKLDNKLTKGSWKIGKAVVNNSNITSTYNGYLFEFTGEKIIKVRGAVSTSGIWDRGDEKNPVILFLTFPPSSPELYIFGGDWQVNQLSSSQVVMNRNGSSEDELVLRKVGK